MQSRNTRTGLLLGAALLLVAPLQAQTPDPTIIEKIKDEGMNRSQVMQTLSYLTDVIGPRLTASPSMKRANEWTRDKMTSWGMQNAHLEAWGPFGRGWELQRFSAQVIEPQDIPLIAYPKAWSPGLKAPITADVVYVDAKSESDLAKYKGQLKGAIVLSGPERPVPAHFTAPGTRYTDAQLAEMEKAERPRGRGQGGPPRDGAGMPEEMRRRMEEFRAQARFASRRLQFLMEEGAAVILDAGRSGDGGTLFVQSATVPAPPPPASNGNANTAPANRGGFQRGPSPWDKNAPKTLPQVTVSVEQYNRMVRMIQQGVKLKMRLELNVKFTDKDLMGYNTVAEIPGSDLKDQVVMAGAHMDSWHSGTGATDNAAGCAVVMEAARILKALYVQPRRTIRVALWSGEEEGLFGSRAYVAQHFGSYAAPTAGGGPGGGFGVGGGPRGELQKKPEYDKISGYFNLDNGTGKIRGVYLQGNEKVGPIFREWLAPFKEMGASTITINNTGGTDHQSFDAVGVPGFQFIQDEVEYETRTHHSNQDVYDRIQADDMKQAAVIMATFLYNTAMRDDALPRKTAQ